MGNAAFTLIEILVSITLLSFIILGLFAMFNQVQRAFRSSMNQVDQLEAGRAVAELLPAELEQITPCAANAYTFCGQMINSAPLTQTLPGTATPALLRTNFLEDCFILLRQNQTWTGIGYCVRTNDLNLPSRLWLPESIPGQTLGAGSLYRWSASTNVLKSDGTPSDPGQLYLAFVAAAQPGSTAISNRICDGVIHFYVQTFATNGFPIFCDGVHTNAYFRTDAFSVPWRYGTAHPVLTVANTTYPGNLSALYFKSNAVPAFVELQLGILEQHAWERYNSIGAPSARLAYLQRPENASRVNLLRQRIPIRNVNPSAYQ